jgi:acetyl-CoA carboxylase biotin carboxyl carrier protein
MVELNAVPVAQLADAEEDLPTRAPTEEEVERVVAGANRLADIVQRTSMQRIAVSMYGVEWVVEAPAPATQVVTAAAPSTVVAAEVVAAHPHVPAALPAADVPPGQPLTSPLVGVFYRAKSPGSPPFVEVGDEVVAGQQVAIVEAMKMMNEVSTNRAGTVTAIHVEDGEVVEYGQLLFTID